MRPCIPTGLAAATALVLPLWAVAAPDATRSVLVVAAPWGSTAQAADLVGRSDGLILRGTRLPWVVVARSDDPDFATRLSEAGAWLVLDAFGLTGCASRGPAPRGPAPQGLAPQGPAPQGPARRS